MTSNDMTETLACSIFFLFYPILYQINDWKKDQVNKFINKKIHIPSIFLKCFMALESIRLSDLRIVAKMIYNISSK